MFTSICMSVLVRTVGAAFVDNSSLSVMLGYARNQDLSSTKNDMADISTTIEALLTLAQHWERLLFLTGGDINMQKSFSYLMAWVYPGIMELTSGASTVLHTIPRTDVNDSFRTLGIYLSPSASQTNRSTFFISIQIIISLA